jgi:hypothetical protein
VGAASSREKKSLYSDHRIIAAESRSHNRNLIILFATLNYQYVYCRSGATFSERSFGQNIAPLPHRLDEI